MAIKIFNLDYRSSQETIDSQVTTINNFLTTKTFQWMEEAWVGAEIFIAQHTNIVPGIPAKIKVFNLRNEVLTNGISATETTVANFLSGKTQIQRLAVEEGVFVLVYQ